MANARDFVDDFLQDGGVYPKVSASPADTSCQVTQPITCVACSNSWTETNLANDQHVALCPFCNFMTPTGL